MIKEALTFDDVFLQPAESHSSDVIITREAPNYSQS